MLRPIEQFLRIFSPARPEPSSVTRPESGTGTIDPTWDQTSPAKFTRDGIPAGSPSVEIVLPDGATVLPGDRIAYLREGRSYQMVSAATAVTEAAAIPNAAGPNSPTAAGSDNSNAGGYAWVNPGNAFSSNDVRAGASVPGTDTGAALSHYLKLTKFGFSIPSDATIRGVVVEVEKFSNLVVTDNEVKLVKNSVVSGNNKASGSNWPSVDTYVSYGGSSDLWGVTLTPTDVNSDNFGVVCSANLPAGSGSRSAAIDHVRMTVYYTQ
jgi:hypothetical protein